jgi:hypothetical protein
MVRRDLSLALALTAGLVALASLGLSTAARAPESPDTDVLTGEQVALRTHWRGTKPLPTDVPILVMAGHADSQAMEGAGTSGATVGLHGGTPMDARMRDELFWNLRVRDAVVALGRERGLNIRDYTPDALTIHDENDSRTNWSVGRRHSAAGGYALEIHFDAYGPGVRALPADLSRRPGSTAARHQHPGDRQAGREPGAASPEPPIPAAGDRHHRAPHR